MSVCVCVCVCISFVVCFGRVVPVTVLLKVVLVSHGVFCCRHATGKSFPPSPYSPSGLLVSAQKVLPNVGSGIMGLQTRVNGGKAR